MSAVLVLDYSILNENLFYKGRFARAVREGGQKEKGWAMRPIPACVRALHCSQSLFIGRGAAGRKRSMEKSALDAAGGEAGGQVLFDAHEEKLYRDGRHEGSGKEVLPLDHVEA